MTSTDSVAPITRLIAEAQSDDSSDCAARAARDRLFPLIEETLKRLARARLRGKTGATFQATMLADQAFLDLLNKESRHFSSRAEFFAIASKHMWQLLAQHARRRRPEKCSPERAAAQAGATAEPVQRLIADERFLRLHDALVELEVSSPRAATAFRVRCFVDWGFSFAQSPPEALQEADPELRSIREVAEILGEKRSTVFRHYHEALAWLRNRFPDYATDF